MTFLVFVQFLFLFRLGRCKSRSVHYTKTRLPCTFHENKYWQFTARKNIPLNAESQYGYIFDLKHICLIQREMTICVRYYICMPWIFTDNKSTYYINQWTNLKWYSRANSKICKKKSKKTGDDHCGFSSLADLVQCYSMRYNFCFRENRIRDVNFIDCLLCVSWHADVFFESIILTLLDSALRKGSISVYFTFYFSHVKSTDCSTD